MASFTVRSATATVVEALTAAHIEVDDVDSNAADGSEKRYYIIAMLDGQDDLRSHVFGPSSTGEHTWDNVLFPADGTWDLELRDVEDDSVVESDTVEVVAPA